MWKPKTLLIILTVIAALTTLALTFTKTAEPSYQGHSLSYWLATPPEDSTTAVMAIGTKAIPWLIRWTKYEPPAWRKKFALLALQHDQKEIFKLLNSPEHNKAIVAFQILGTNALPALLPLVDIMKDTNHRTPLVLRPTHSPVWENKRCHTWLTPCRTQIQAAVRPSSSRSPSWQSAGRLPTPASVHSSRQQRTRPPWSVAQLQMPSSGSPRRPSPTLHLNNPLTLFALCVLCVLCG